MRGCKLAENLLNAVLPFKSQMTSSGSVAYTFHVGGTYADSWNALAVTTEYIYGSVAITSNADPVFASEDNYKSNWRPRIPGESLLLQVRKRMHVYPVHTGR